MDALRINHVHGLDHLCLPTNYGVPGKSFEGVSDGRRHRLLVLTPYTKKEVEHLPYIMGNTTVEAFCRQAVKQQQTTIIFFFGPRS